MPSQDQIPSVYFLAMKRDRARRHEQIQTAVLAWRFDRATVRRAFDLFAAGGAPTPSVRGMLARGLT